MRRWFAPCALGMVLLYAALALGAAGCLFMPKEEHEHDHHAPTHAGHSTLCAWACQVNPTVSLHAAAPILTTVLLVMTLRLVSAVPQFFLTITVSRSRAPPQ
jgi:hypothetical protein